MIALAPIDPKGIATVTHEDLEDADQPQWAIVQINGGDAYAGRLSQQQVAGVLFVRVDVPESADVPGFTRLMSAAAIYLIDYVSEAAAREHQRRHRLTPPFASFEDAQR